MAPSNDESTKAKVNSRFSLTSYFSSKLSDLGIWKSNEDKPSTQDYRVVKDLESDNQSSKTESTESELEVSHHETEPQEAPSKNSRRIPDFKNTVLLCITLPLAIIAGASIGPVFKYMEQSGISPCLSASWRCQCMTIFLIPLAMFEAYSDKKNRVEWFSRKPDLPFPIIVHVIISGLAWAANLLFWIVGLQYTTAFKASVFATSHPILLVLYFKFANITVSWLEWGGVFVSFGGMILSGLRENHSNTTTDSTVDQSTNGTSTSSSHHEGTSKWEVLGLFFCLIAAAAEVCVLFNRIATKKYVPVMQYTAATTLVVVTMASIASLCLEGGVVISSSSAPHGIQVFCTEEHCIFGWMSKKWVLTILLFGFWVGVIVIAGFNFCMQYISPLVFSSLGLMDPALTAILSWLIGVESWPNALSWIGGAIVMSGVGLITVGENKRHEEEKKLKLQHQHGTSVVDSNSNQNSSDSNSLKSKNSDKNSSDNDSGRVNDSHDSNNKDEEYGLEMIEQQHQQHNHHHRLFARHSPIHNTTAAVATTTTNPMYTIVDHDDHLDDEDETKEEAVV